MDLGPLPLGKRDSRPGIQSLQRAHRISLPSDHPVCCALIDAGFRRHRYGYRIVPPGRTERRSLTRGKTAGSGVDMWRDLPCCRVEQARLPGIICYLLAVDLPSCFVFPQLRPRGRGGGRERCLPSLPMERGDGATLVILSTITSWSLHPKVSVCPRHKIQSRPQTATHIPSPTRTPLPPRPSLSLATNGANPHTTPRASLLTPPPTTTPSPPPNTSSSLPTAP